MMGTDLIEFMTEDELLAEFHRAGIFTDEERRLRSIDFWVRHAPGAMSKLKLGTSATGCQPIFRDPVRPLGDLGSALGGLGSLIGRKIRFVGGATRTVTAVDRESSVITIDASVDPGPADEFKIYPK